MNKGLVVKKRLKLHKEFHMQRGRSIRLAVIFVVLAVAGSLSRERGNHNADSARNAGAAYGATREASADPLVAMFVWWNAAYKQKDGFSEAAFSHYFTSDAVMRINGSDRCKGVADLARHFRDIQARTEAVSIVLPFIDEFTSADGTQIFTHHFVLGREHGKDSRDRVMGYATIRDGKISLINFVSVPDESAAAAPTSGVPTKK